MPQRISINLKKRSYNQMKPKMLAGATSLFGESEPNSGGETIFEPTREGWRWCWHTEEFESRKELHIIFANVEDAETYVYDFLHTLNTVSFSHAYKYEF